MDKKVQSLKGTKNLLVIGDVKPRTYGEAYEDLQKNGYIVEIIQISCEDFLLTPQQLVEEHATEAEKDRCRKLDVDLYDPDLSLLVQLAARRLSAFDPIGLIVMDTVTWAAWSDDARPEFVRAHQALTTYPDRWVARSREVLEFVG